MSPTRADSVAYQKKLLRSKLAHKKLRGGRVYSESLRIHNSFNMKVGDIRLAGKKFQVASKKTQEPLFLLNVKEKLKVEACCLKTFGTWKSEGMTM